MFRKADYCKDFLRYTWTEVLSRLFDMDLEMIHSIPKLVEVDLNSSISEKEFWNKFVDKTISIEE